MPQSKGPTRNTPACTALCLPPGQHRRALLLDLHFQETSHPFWDLYHSAVNTAIKTRPVRALTASS